MADMLRPESSGGFTLRDFKRQPKISGLFFNILFNINKFIAYEQRDPFLARQQENELGGLSAWDRFAQVRGGPCGHRIPWWSRLETNCC